MIIFGKLSILKKSTLCNKFNVDNLLVIYELFVAK